MELKTEKPKITAKNYPSVGPGEYPCGNNLYLIVTATGGRRWAFRYQRNGIVPERWVSAQPRQLALTSQRPRTKRLTRCDSSPREPTRKSSEMTRGGAPRVAPVRRVRRGMAADLRDRPKTQGRAQQAQAHRTGDQQTTPQAAARQDRDRTRHCGSADGLASARDLARRASAAQEDFLDAAIALNLRPKHNPADWDSRLKPIMPKQSKRGTVRGSHKAMDYHDLPAFMQKLAANSEQSARALEVAILTLARTIEVQNMRWSQLDLESGLWNLGTVDTKNERPKRSPLPRQTFGFA